jgi:putative serine protease PepD
MTSKTLPTLLAAAALAGGTGGAAVVRTLDEPATAATRATSTSTTGSIYRAASAGVVDIKATGVQSQSDGGPYGQPPSSSGSSEGSGFVIDTKGDIVTNDHVIDGASSIKVTFSDGTTATARIVRSDASSDLAVLRVTVPASKLHPLTFADSSGVQVGDTVLAIGSPFGLDETLTEGIVSATGRSIEAENNATIAGAIQTDAAINPGNSGGPLLNQDGQVVGVNAQIASQSGGNEGVGFAIAANTVKSVVGKLVAGQTVDHASLGVVIGDASGGGAQVGSLSSGSAAGKAGVRSGDTITGVDGTAVAGADALAAIVASHQPGDTIRLSLRRDGKTREATVTLGSR